MAWFAYVSFFFLTCYGTTYEDYHTEATSAGKPKKAASNRPMSSSIKCAPFTLVYG